MRNATEILVQRAKGIDEGVQDLLDRSSLTHFDRSSGAVVWLGPTGEWGDLDVEARRVQARVIHDYRRFCDMASVLLRDHPPDTVKELERADRSLTQIIEQSTATWLSSVEEARERAADALATQISLLDRLHDAADGADIYVTDTNALLHHPDLDKWRFEASKTFEIALAPSVLAELDELKVNYRNAAIREKAEGLITRIKGYRDRGQLSAGVPLRKPTSTIRSYPTEPRMDASLPWLDAGNRDDRFIATVIEIVREHPRNGVVIVTRDINLQNKAELASLPFVEPPDPT